MAQTQVRHRDAESPYRASSITEGGWKGQHTFGKGTTLSNTNSSPRKGYGAQGAGSLVYGLPWRIPPGKTEWETTDSQSDADLCTRKRGLFSGYNSRIWQLGEEKTEEVRACLRRPGPA